MTTETPTETKDPIPFVRQGTDRDPEFWACGGCGTVRNSEQAARDCCGKSACKECGALVNPYLGLCFGCRSIRTDNERWEKAKKVPVADYDGPVFCDATDRYYRDAGEWLEACEDDEREPGRAYGCFVCTLQLDIAGALESAMEDIMLDDPYGLEWNDEGELRAFVDEWNTKQTATWWEADYSTGIVVGQ